ncbi:MULTISPECIES: TetR/AcrR family transcriptional regulator [Mycolicibacterium]|uniref:TetR/AcrR family transcriptional regulator n=1 Tax=Mycolicibacterium TaxID=1866885 RepID=UPI0011D5DCA7|nr:TetR/AcrR family transcriptional regulator [Mycolicibacterium mageritense]MBN3453518.1 TetR/AcrR family transcriptional regulator [Mycobacterium sp. DSM 3803]TXI61169.1 MAG: TetR/AcrR family transcriptional regulator [Mycolicibacterium mageritense]
MAVGTVRERAAHLGPERRRPQVLDAALAVVMDHGVAAVTIGAVAKQLKVTRPVVYSCFPDRVELIRALLERELGLLLRDAIDALPYGKPDADETVFIQGFQALLHTVARRPFSWRLVMSADPDPAVAEHFRNGRAVLVDKVTRRLAPTLDRWGTADADKKLPVLVEQFMAACEAAVRTLLRDDGKDWTPDTLGAFVGSAIYRAFRTA